MVIYDDKKRLTVENGYVTMILSFCVFFGSIYADLYKGKPQMRGHWRKGSAILIISFIATSVTLLLVVSGVAILLMSDYIHENLKDRIDTILQGTRYFRGELWFSAEVTLVGAVISAIPGLCCGVLALVQSNMIHDLEARYHRPSMELEKAELLFIKTEKVKEMFENAKIDPELGYRLKQIENDLNKVFIKLDFKFFVKNEISLKKICLQKVIFHLPSTIEKNQTEKFELQIKGEDWERKKHVFWDYSKHIEQSRSIYTFSCDLYPNKKIYSKQTEEKFWESIKEFAFYSDRQWEIFKYLTLDIFLEVYYEYGRKNEVSMLRVEFNAIQPRSGPNKYMIQKDSNNGYFTFEIEEKK